MPPRSPNWYLSLLPILFALISSPSDAAAQGHKQPTPPTKIVPQRCVPCDPGCPCTTHIVLVTPKGTQISWQAPSTGHAAVFTAKNQGNASEGYTFACSATGKVTCTSLDKTTATLGAGVSTLVTATYAVSDSGSGVLTLTATGTIAHDTDNGTYNVTGTLYHPEISLEPQNGGTRPADVFDVVQNVTTPAYQSLGTSRALVLQYNSSTVRPTPVVSVDVTTPITPYPTVYGMQVQLASNQSYLTLLNGTNTVYYAAPGTTAAARLVAAIDAKANNLSTGWYDVNVIVTGYYASTTKSTTATTRLLVDDESGSAFGAGWEVAGVQQLYTMPGSYSALITNGDGSMSFFRRDCSTCAFVSSAGDPTQVAVYSGPDTGIGYRRAAPDSSAVDFRSDGRMVRLWSGTLHRPAVIMNWSGAQLMSVQDMIGKRLTLGYTGPASQSGKLQTITDPAGRITTVWTDSAGRVYRVSDPDSLATTFAYDASLRLTGITDRAGATTNVTYDALNRVDSTKGPTITDYAGSAIRPTLTEAAPARIVWQPTIAGTSSANAKGSVRADTVSAKMVDPVGNVTRVAYDRFGGATKIIDPLGQVTTIQRDTLGQATGVTMPNGHVVTNTYTGYLLTSTYDNATGQITNYSYNGFSRVITVSGNAHAPRTDIYYKPAYAGSGDFGPVDHIYGGNAGTHASPTGGHLTASYLYNTWGQDSIVTDGAGHKVTVLYSDTTHYSNPVQVTDPFARVVSKAHYDGAGRPDTVWAPSNGSLMPSVLTYDQVNRATTVKDPLGFTTRYAYGPTTLNRIIDPKGQVYRFDYNALGWTTTRRDLADTTKADTLKYDAAGRTRTIRTRRSDAISLTYDPLGRVLTRSGPDFPVDSFRYDPAGRWMVALNPNAYDSIASDVAGRLVYSLERLVGDASYIMTFSYDTLGRPISRSAPQGGSVVTYGYSPTQGTLDTLCAAGQCSVWAARDSDNIAHVLGFGVNNTNHWQQTIAIDSAHRVVSDSFQGTSVAHLNTEFAKQWFYDTLGRVTNEWPWNSVNGYGGYKYRYDANGRMVNACADYTTGSPIIGLHRSCIDEYGEETEFTSITPYRYDSTGNRRDSLAMAVVGPGNHLTQFRGYVLAYDLNGNVISKKGSGGSWASDTTLFTWNASGVLTRVERWTPGAAHKIITYAYDALGRRVAKTVGTVTERYVHDGNGVVEDIDGATHALKAEYAWGPGGDNLLYVRSPSWTAGVILDPLNGTVRGLAMANGGQTVKQYPASYWGEISPDTGFVVRFRHAGREYDAEAGLYYNRARYYDPSLGRFLSEDPLGPAAGGINLYTYAGNDPIDNRDPSGLRYYGDDWTPAWDDGGLDAGDPADGYVLAPVVVEANAFITDYIDFWRGGPGGTLGHIFGLPDLGGGEGAAPGPTPPSETDQQAPTCHNVLGGAPQVLRANSGFGDRGDTHQGVDILAPIGTPVTAFDDGTVVSADYNQNGYGMQVIISHMSPGGGVYYSQYAHLTPQLAVTRGARVARGQIVGTVGMSGNADALSISQAHLHFEFRDRLVVKAGMEGRVNPTSSLCWSP